MTSDLARPAATAIRPHDDSQPFEGFRLLSKHNAEPVVPAARQDWAATVSAGWSEQTAKGRIPKVSRDQKIHLSDANGHAPFLKECLEKSDYKTLTVSFASNDLNAIFRQSYVNYTATRLLARGDDREMVVFDAQQGRRILPAGTPEYERARSQCQITRSMFFVLADWINHEPSIVYDPRDGFVSYRLNTGSQTSLERLVSQVVDAKAKCNGNIIAVPFELSIGNERRADGRGELHDVPIWRLVIKPEVGVSFGIRQFVAMRSSAMEQSRLLALPEPPSSEVEGRIIEGEFHQLVDEEQAAMHVDQADLDRMARGAPVDSDAARRRWFAIVKGSRFAEKDGRADWVAAWTDGNHASLAEWIAQATQEEVDTMLTTLQLCVEQGQRLPRAWEGIQLSEPEPDPLPGRIIVDEETGEMFDPADILDDEPFGDVPAEEEPTAAEPTPMDDDLLTLSRQRLQALEQARSPSELEMAWYDCERDSDLLGDRLMGDFTAAYNRRKDALQVRA